MRAKRKTLKFSTILFVLMLVAAITFFLLALFTPTKNSSSDDTATTTPQTTTTLGDEDNSSDENSAEDTEQTPETTPTADVNGTIESEKEASKYRQPTVKETGKIPLSIVRNEVNNGRYTLSIMSDERLDATDSTCTLIMTSGQNSVKRQTDVHDAPSSSGCLFQFDTSGVSSGDYSFTVTIKSGSRTGSVSNHIKL